MIITYIDENLSIAGTYVRVVPSRNRFYVIDNGKVLSIKDDHVEAMEEAKGELAYPDVVHYNGVVYIGDFYEMKPGDDLGFIICKGTEILYSYQTASEALERFRSL